MMGLGVCKYLIKEIYLDMRLWGKILFAPFVVVATIALTAFGIIEIFLIDIWAILIEIAKKDGDAKSMIKWLLGF